MSNYTHEYALLGSIFDSEDVFLKVKSEILPEMFLHGPARAIYQCMIDHNTNDQIAAHGWLPTHDQWFMMAIESTCLKSGIPAIVELIKDRYRRSLVYKATKEAFEQCADYDISTDDVRVKLRDVLEITEKRASSEPEHISEILKRVCANVHDAQKGVIQGIKWGFIDIDKEFGGLLPQELITIAGRPGMGKSSFVCQVAVNAALQEKSVAIFSLEMSKEMTSGRILFQDCRKNYDTAMRGWAIPKRDYEKIEFSLSKISGLSLFVDDQGAQSTAQIFGKCRKLKQQYGLDLIIIDHIGLIKESAGRSRHDEISKISKQCLGFAKHFNCPVIQLSQLNREVEKREKPIPQLSDLRESGSIEEDSNKVVFLYRPDYYFEKNEEYIKTGLCEIHFAKNRNGRCANVDLTFDGPSMRFGNKSDRTDEPEWPESTGEGYVK